MKKPRHETSSAAKRTRSASAADEGDRHDHPADHWRWSSRRKTEVFLRILRGETLGALSRELGVNPGKPAQSRDEALASMQAGFRSRKPDHRDGFLHDLKDKVGD